MCHPRLLALKEKDELGEEALHLLETYLFNGRNVVATAKKLFIHRNTLAYRLEKLTEQLQMDLTEMDDTNFMWLLISSIILKKH